MPRFSLELMVVAAALLSGLGHLPVRAARMHGGVVERGRAPEPAPRADRKDRDPIQGVVGVTRYGVTFHNLHTRELLPVPVSSSRARKGGAGAPYATRSKAKSLPSQDRLQRFLRCRATGDRHPMASKPFALAIQAARDFEADRIEVISGFRSPKLNELLRKKGHEVASRSKHLLGEALDFRVPGVPAVQLSRYAAARHVGGIGTYPESDFIHVDVGPHRRWRGK